MRANIAGPTHSLSDVPAAAGERAIADAITISRWLFFVAGLIVIMALIGAATRLTGSGLSITEWEVVRGTVPPLSEAAWAAAFEKYKQIPQYTRVNAGMSLAEFKVIYWWEWGHRFFGRLIGLAFVGPLVWFWLKGMLSNRRALQLLGILALGTLQAFVGWFMVQSGLVDRVSVSPVRLAMHLTLAVLVFALVLWLALETRSESRAKQATPAAWCVQGGAFLLLLLAFAQIVLGAFVAGTKAGLTYNTWPLMDGRLIPNGLGTLSPLWLNLIENVTTVQFNHRIMAYVLLIAGVWHAVALAITGAPRQVQASARMLAAMIAAQSVLGIWTLLAVVPISLGLAHQLGALAVVATGVWHLHRAVRGSAL